MGNKLFVSQDETVIIPVWVGTKENGILAVSKSEEDILKVEGLKSDTLEKHEVEFRRPGYGDDVQIMSRVMASDGETVKVNVATIRYERFMALLKSWTFKDAEGNAVPATGDNINKIATPIANFLMDQMDTLIYPD